MRRRTKGLKGNIRTRSRATHSPGLEAAAPFQFRDESTKFYKRPPRLTTKAKWKKYPVPFIWKNPFPEGDVIVAKKFYKIKEAA